MLFGMENERTARRRREIGTRIRQARSRAGLSQEGLGTLLKPNVTDGTISNWERGITSVEVPVLEELGRILKQPLQFFTGESEPRHDTEAEQLGHAVLRFVEERQMLKERTFKSAGSGMRRFPIENRVPASDASVRESQLEDDIEVPDALWMGAQWPRVFYVAGACMTGAGIVEGDHVIIDGAKTSPRNGQIVIAQVNGGLTLKRFYRAGEMVELRPKAPGFESIYVGPGDELIILGCLHNVYATGDREGD